MTPYEPPRQPLRGQLVDALVILLLLFGTLFASTFVAERFGGATTSAENGADATKPISELPITEAEKQQFQTMVNRGMVDEQAVAAAVDANHPDPNKYAFNPLLLLVMAAILAGYLIFVYAMSFKEYREVVHERFGRPRGDAE